MPYITTKVTTPLPQTKIDTLTKAYGKLIEVEFVEKLRDEKKFSGLPELTAAISADCERAKAILGVKVQA